MRGAPLSTPPAPHLDLGQQVDRANLYDEQALRSLGDLLGEMQQASDTSAWGEPLRLLAGLEPRGLREAAARLLGCRSCEDGPLRELLGSLVQSPRETERGLGLLALGYLEAPTAEDLSCLREALELPQACLAWAASASLGRLGRTSAAAADAVYEMYAGGGEERAVDGLAILSGSEALAQVLIQEAADSPAPSVRLAVARALSEADPMPRFGIPILGGLLDDPLAAVQIQALAGLTLAGAQFSEAVARLHACASNLEHPLRHRALRSLGEAAGTSAEAATAVSTRLEQTIEAMDVMSLALGLSTGMRTNADRCLPLVAEVARKDDEEVMAFLAQALTDAASAGPAVAVGMVYGLVREGSPPILFSHLATHAGLAGTLAADLLCLWEGGCEPVAALATARRTLEAAGDAAGVIPEILQLLETLTHFATVDEILAAAADLSQVLPACRATLGHLEDDVAALRDWVEDLARFETETEPEAQSNLIKDALQRLDALRACFEEGNRFPTGRTLVHLAVRWKAVVVQTLFAARRGADVALRIVGRQVARNSQGILSLEVTNRGPGLAYQVVLEMSPSPDYAPHLGSHSIPSLGPGESRVVDFTFTPNAVGKDYLRVEFRARYSDFADSDRTALLTEDVPFRAAADYTPIPNPYIPGLPLELGSELFMGRDDIFKFIEETLDPHSKRRVMILTGQRRMGKTSILRNIPLRLPLEVLTVFVDCQGLECQGVANLLYHMAYIISDVLEAEEVPCTIPELEAFQERPFFTFEHGFLKPVLASLQGRTLLILMDEFQALDEAVDSGQLEETVFGFLKTLIQHHDKLSFLFSGLQKRLGETRDHWPVVFNIALRTDVGLLDEAHSRRLIEKPVDGFVRYDPQAVNELIRLCCGHPYLTQLFCDRLISHLNEIQESEVHAHHIHEVIPHVYASGVNHFYSLWEDLSGREKIVLVAISANCTQQRFATLSSITRFIRERGIAVDLDEVTTVLQTLLGHDLITFVHAQPPGYSFKVLLIHYWIEREMLQSLVGGTIKWQ